MMRDGVYADWLNVGRDWRVNVVDDISDRHISSLHLFEDLPRDPLYDLHIEYNTLPVKPHDARDLTYEMLRREIAKNLVVPSHRFMNIFVAHRKDGRRQ